MIIPKAHNEDHSFLEGFTHPLEATVLSVIVVVLEQILRVFAEGVSDGVKRAQTLKVCLLKFKIGLIKKSSKTAAVQGGSVQQDINKEFFWGLHVFMVNTCHGKVP